MYVSMDALCDPSKLNSFLNPGCPEIAGLGLGEFRMGFFFFFFGRAEHRLTGLLIQQDQSWTWVFPGKGNNRCGVKALIVAKVPR